MGDKFDEYLYICLHEQAKGERDIRYHVLLYVVETNSGIHIKNSLYQLLSLKAPQGLYDGPGMSHIKGALFSTQTMDIFLKEGLDDIYATHRELSPKTIKPVE